MRIIAVEALDEIFVLVVIVVVAAIAVIVMGLLLLSKALHPVVHVARYRAAT